jgi:hypothetical protein
VESQVKVDDFDRVHRGFAHKFYLSLALDYQPGKGYAHAASFDDNKFCFSGARACSKIGLRGLLFVFYGLGTVLGFESLPGFFEQPPS